MAGTKKPASRYEQWVHLTQIIQGVATAGALMLGAWWFIEQRQTYPHAQVAQTVAAVPVGKGLIAVEVQVQFQNSGKRLIHLTHATVKLQQVAGEPYGYAALADATGDAYWKAQRPSGAVAMKDRRQFNEGELRWPLLNQYDDAVEHFVEPGETDVLVFTFLVPCQPDPADPGSALHVVRVASDIHKPAKGGEVDLAWKARAFADVTAACSGKGPGNEG